MRNLKRAVVYLFLFNSRVMKLAKMGKIKLSRKLSCILYMIFKKKPNHRIYTYFFVSLTSLCCVNSCIASERPVPQSARYIITYFNTSAVVYHTTFYSTLKDWSNLLRQRDLPKYVSDENCICYSFQVIKSIVVNLT